MARSIQSIRLLGMFIFLGFGLLHGSESPSFFIEHINIENLKHVSERIVRAELQLDTGQEYDEEQLRQALYRVERLQFIRETEFSLEKGSRRGAYVLKIHVTETRRLFWLLLTDSLLVRNNYRLSDEPGTSKYLANLDGQAFGYRWFSRKTEWRVFLPGGFAMTHYDLFGTGMVVDAGLGIPPSFNSRDFDFGTLPFTEDGSQFEIAASDSTLIAFSSLTYPISQEQSLNLGMYSGNIGISELQSRGTEEKRKLEDTEFQFNFATLNWTHNTTDHPYFPLTGRFIQAGLQWEWNQLAFDEATQDLVGGYDTWTWSRNSVVASYKEFWQLNSRDSFGLDFDVRYAGVHVSGKPEELALETEDYVSARGGIELSLSRNLMNRRFLYGSRDFRVTLSAGYRRYDTDLDEEKFTPDPNYGMYHAGVGLTMRDSWGAFRITVRYEQSNRGLWP
ncbi:hypothetical protein SCOR_18560 [Sulfidibacter corallicola]|uniref:POTRA domain-containing protein n=1 Tax=Sulfidibacter corallicola TaxID=2818388 RepID=A0A8A4TWJ3_SULCO|nr:POTRA domain-containing protein [Sulfidibacter corallicola]QTD53548.1 hypothetical protein J3U87_13920 [Sulfidibacter corallicola]